jgi:antitoxin ParD1/3/4
MSAIKLSPDLEAFVQEQVERGRFRSANDVVSAGLRLLAGVEAEKAERLADVRRKIDEALKDTRPSVPAENVFARLERKHAARLSALRDEP